MKGDKKCIYGHFHRWQWVDEVTIVCDVSAMPRHFYNRFFNDVIHYFYDHVLHGYVRKR